MGPELGKFRKFGFRQFENKGEQFESDFENPAKD